MPVLTFDINIVCKKCRSTDVDIGVGNREIPTLTCNKCGNEEQII